jgi:hypothetical protein
VNNSSHINHSCCNTYYFDSPAVQAELKALPAAESAVYAPLPEVQASYLQAGFAQVTTSYGPCTATPCTASA